MKPAIELRPITRDDAAWIGAVIAAEWGEPFVVSRRRVYHPHDLPGFIASLDGETVGMVTYLVDGSDCEIVTLNSTREGIGVGTALIDAVAGTARDAGCARIVLVTTNDNVDALGFYQRRGFHLVAVHRNAVDDARLLKPSIPLVGLHAIPLRDEIELELPLE